MLLSRLRAPVVVLLILFFASFTGIVTTVAALERPEATDACCERNESQPAPAGEPCPDGNCLCFSCLAFDLTYPILLGHPLQISDMVFSLPHACCPDGFTAAIDYPPEPV